MRHVALSLAVLAALSACGQPKAVAVKDAWVRLPAAPGRPGAGYFTLTGGATDQTLIAVSSPAAPRIELHETMNGGGQMGAGMTMTPIAQLNVPAGATITFAPGGKHLMLFDVKPGVKAGGTIKLDFAFADGKPLTVDAKVIAAGDPPPQ